MKDAKIDAVSDANAKIAKQMSSKNAENRDHRELRALEGKSIKSSSTYSKDRLSM
jgi:hypothetical protein